MKENSIGKRTWRYFKKTVRFLLSAKRSEILTFLLFFFIATLFWFLENAQTVNETVISYPVKYRQLPGSVTISGELTPYVRVTVRDKGMHLYGYHFHRKSHPLEVDLMSWKNPEGVSRIPLSAYEAALSQALRPEAQIMRIQPDSLRIYYIEKESREVALHLNASIGTAPQYMLSGQPVLSPSTVTVFAPPAILDTLSCVETEPVTFKDLNDTTTAVLKIQSIDGARFSPGQVEVSIPVEAYTEASFELPVVGKNLPQGIILHTFPARIRVSFLVGVSQYAFLSAEDFELSIDYQYLTEHPGELQPILLSKAPAHVSRIRLSPDKADCLIEINPQNRPL
ncbi:MAG: hypothetical protein IJ154_01930 [Bacteroidales bacterium]|nr:hypothetical protein [Bacteroidales bacterium]